MQTQNLQQISFGKAAIQNSQTEHRMSVSNFALYLIQERSLQ